MRRKLVLFHGTNSTKNVNWLMVVCNLIEEISGNVGSGKLETFQSDHMTSLQH